jgi:hypothetical protein
VTVHEGASLEHTGTELPGEERDSGLTINVTLSVGYQRRRPNTGTDRWEARVDSLGLLIVGAIVVAIILLYIIPRLLGWLGQ